ncbi:heavy-metal-associated domain-containing protein [Duganella sp. HSC-15S17]|nr:heavy-metal-associated domain-containing protein [Duganella violaceicalia]
MDGEACADTIAKLLAEIDGVSDVRVSLRDRVARARIDETRVSPHRLMRTLSLAGYPASVQPAEAPAAPDATAANAGGCCGGCCGG